ncbi:MAG TPA: M48 family metallopeptidase [Thermoanaerobaculia bacterium]|jgi:STE24 endopeptidase|nr:M48 family metallopeptidase [Thermoanaerobaculia bacterium]
MKRTAILLLAALAIPALGFAQNPPPPASPSPSFDPVAATEAYLARLTPEQREKSDSYFEGGYWLMLWGFLYGLGVAALLLGTRISARMRDLSERMIGFRPLQIFLYWLQYLLLTTILGFPLTLYDGYFREHKYGLSNQTFGAWMNDLLKGLGVGALLGGIAVVAVYTIFRRLPRTWWIWGTAAALVFVVLGALIAPVFIAPLFNTYTELKVPNLRGPILALARANGIPAKHVYVFDASRQTKRVSANVSGAFGTMRISLNDNLLNRVSPAGVKSVMGHEMGHYVLNHVYESILWFALVFLLGFAFLRWAFDRAVARWGQRWGVRGIADPAGLPLLAALFSVYFFVMTPFNNTFIRTNEAEADIFGLNAAREPDGFAETSLLLGEYRKLHPGPVEEWIFFDHPSGYNRILMAMSWKKEHGPGGELEP